MVLATRHARSRRPLGLALAVGVIGFAAMPAATFAQQAPAAPKAAPRPPAAAPAAPPPGAPQMGTPGAPPAGAQGQGGPQIVQVKAEPSQPEWTKVCGKDQGANAEICYTTRDFVSDQGQPVLAVAIYDVKAAQPQKVVRFLLPLGLLIQTGTRFAVDQGQPNSGRFAICFPNGCFAETTGLKDEFIAQMKKGTTLNVSVQNQVGREVTFAVPLAGFGKAYDGAPVDPKVLEDQQKKLQDELQKKSDEMRKKLEQSAAQPGAAPKQ